jgi:DNA helicase-2/ATP-dependent DNA helicase PcrA
MILSTIHSAKGQEWTSVFLLNTVDGCMPSDLATGSTPEIEEERRLLYVAMTRAKDQLHLMVPQRFYTHGQRSTGDRHVYAQRTRFISNAMLSHFQTGSWPPPRLESRSEKGRSNARVDLRATMRARWG